MLTLVFLGTPGLSVPLVEFSFVDSYGGLGLKTHFSNRLLFLLLHFMGWLQVHLAPCTPVSVWAGKNE